MAARGGAVAVVGGSVRVGQHSAAEVGGVDDTESGVGGPADQFIGAAVDQGVAVVGEQHLEDVQVEEAMHHVHVTAGDTEVADDAFVPKLDQLLDGAAGAVESLVEGVLGVVEVDQREVVETESFRAFLDGASNSAGGVVAVLPVDLGGDPVAGREPSDAADAFTDASFALAVGVDVGGVDEADGAAQDLGDQGDGLFGGHVVAEHLGHAADRSAAGGDGGDGEPGVSQWSEPTLGHD